MDAKILVSGDGRKRSPRTQNPSDLQTVGGTVPAVVDAGWKPGRFFRLDRPVRLFALMYIFCNRY